MNPSSSTPPGLSSSSVESSSVVVVMLLSFPAVHFYHDARLYGLMPVLGFGLVLDGLCQQQHDDRRPPHRRQAAARHRLRSSRSSPSAVTVAWAYFWPSVWALVVGTLSLFRLQDCIVSHIPAILPGIRNKFAWEKEAVHSLVHFGKWIIARHGLLRPGLAGRPSHPRSNWSASPSSASMASHSPSPISRARSSSSSPTASVCRSSRS